MIYLQFILLVLAGISKNAVAQNMDIQPFLSFLRPENMRSMAELATELSSMATKNIAENERDIQKTASIPQPIDPQTARPSQMIGGALSNIAYQSRNAILDVLSSSSTTTPTPITFGMLPTTLSTTVIPNIFGAKTVEIGNGNANEERDVLGVKEFKRPKEIRYAEASSSGVVEEVAAASIPNSEPLSKLPPPQNAFDGSPFMQIARRFLQVGNGQQKDGEGMIPQIGIRDFVSNSDSNFGIPKGKGCLPFISEFMQIAYGNCQNVADEKTFDAWGDELRSAILTGEIDLLKASQETCRRGAERQQCDALREAVANCDVMASIEIGSQLQRNMKRCEEVSGIIDQNPAAVLGQLNNLISGEMAQGFLNNFLKNG
ncbi:unnamed protein product [Caenorhabditis angaria]|uniref:Uncharacterized protein n=1 Tax=Caenorhabditis angaria TaxID=860376 RepID=A0A9P1IU10_9PELO|nr:unnamed protein product [Caenorhabditis angaria]